MGEGVDDLGEFGFFDACVGEGGGDLVCGFHVVGEVFAEFLEVDFCGGHGVILPLVGVVEGGAWKCCVFFAPPSYCT